MIELTNGVKTTIIDALKELNCCSRCIIMYLGVRSQEPYQAPENYLDCLLADLIDSTKATVKKPRISPCRVCLGILEGRTIETLVSNIPVNEANSYKHKDFAFNISLPKVQPIRDHSMFIYMKEKFPLVYAQRGDLLFPKAILTNAILGIFSMKINKEYNKASLLAANIDIIYENDERESENVKLLTSAKDKTSKSVIARLLDQTDENTFRKHFKIPADPPEDKIDVRINFASGMTYLGGRYLKFSRDMGQTPWIIDDKPMTEFCVSDIIFDSIEKTLGYKKENMTFSASGREDADVRMLGNGRPFYIQVLDAKDPDPTFEKCRAVEEDIIKSNLTAVVKLQPVSTTDIKLVKEGEEHKRKHYRALCITTCPIDEVVERINGISSLEIDQKTPIRVLHRRTLAVRKKCIHEIKARPVSGKSNLFYLDMVTQAGTYVKEFVHSDFHRTKPSIAELLAKPTDIVALDVTKVELDWP